MRIAVFAMAVADSVRRQRLPRQLDQQLRSSPEERQLLVEAVVLKTKPFSINELDGVGVWVTNANRSSDGRSASGSWDGFFIT